MAPKKLKESPSEDSVLLLEKLKLTVLDLEKKLNSKKEKCRILQESNDDLQSTINIEKTNHRDIVDFLKAQIQEKQDENNQLDHKIHNLELEKEELKSEHEVQMHLLKENNTISENKLRAEIAKLEKELNSVIEFKMQKVDLEAELEEMKGTRELEKKGLREKMTELERDLAREKEKLLREKEIELKSITASLIEMSNNNLSDTTKLTIIENQHISQELAFQSKQSMELITDNDRLKMEMVEVRRQLDLQKEMSQKLTASINKKKKLISSLKQQLKELENSFVIDRNLWIKEKENLAKRNQENQYLREQDEENKRNDEFDSLASSYEQVSKENHRLYSFLKSALFELNGDLDHDELIRQELSEMPSFNKKQNEEFDQSEKDSILRQVAEKMGAYALLSTSLSVPFPLSTFSNDRSQITMEHSLPPQMERALPPHQQNPTVSFSNFPPLTRSLPPKSPSSPISVHSNNSNNINNHNSYNYSNTPSITYSPPPSRISSTSVRSTLENTLAVYHGFSLPLESTASQELMYDYTRKTSPTKKPNKTKGKSATSPKFAM